MQAKSTTTAMANTWVRVWRDGLRLHPRPFACRHPLAAVSARLPAQVHLPHVGRCGALGWPLLGTRDGRFVFRDYGVVRHRNAYTSHLAASRKTCIDKQIRLIGHAEAVSHESEKIGPEREENGLSGPFPGLPCPVRLGGDGLDSIAESLVNTVVNTTARRIAPVGRFRPESVPQGYAHWRRRESNPGPVTF
jgi:hypothetical protein